jgi:hypothetical protein
MNAEPVRSAQVRVPTDLMRGNALCGAWGREVHVI